MRKIIAVLALALVSTALAAVPAQAAVDPYQAWLDETAVVAHHYDKKTGKDTTTTYTERQVGVPAFQQMMQQRLATTGSVQPQTIYWNCLNGIGCIWKDINGGGTKLQIPIGVYGARNCDLMPSTLQWQASSASADYGSSYDLLLSDAATPNPRPIDPPCSMSVFADYINVLSSHSVNFTGSLAYLNDATAYFSICDQDPLGAGADCYGH